MEESKPLVRRDDKDGMEEITATTTPQKSSPTSLESRQNPRRVGWFSQFSRQNQYRSLRVGRGAPMSSNDVRHGFHSPGTPNFFGSLSRSATTSKVGQSPKAFGEKTYMNKEDHERERARWLSKLDEIEARLAESETLNVDMHQIKAELNKKIVDLEKNQRPLIDQNRKVYERNKLLQQEVKKVEQKLCHSQDDFLTLKDAHERVVKENVQLKEKRANPEKIEELERYRNQVLEYSKCITALRSSGLEKDRRYELLVQKFKRLRKCMKKGDQDDDGHSTFGSDCSAESSISLNTINEDFEESLNKDIEINYQALYRENAELQKALHELKLTSSAPGVENLLKEQLAVAHTTIAQQQILIDGNREMISHAAQLKSLVRVQQEKIRELELRIESLTHEITASRSENELLEFQMLELEETSKCDKTKEQEKIVCENKEVETSEEFEDPSIEIDVCTKELNKDELAQLKANFKELKKSANLKLSQRQVVGQAEGYLENLENRFVASSEAGKVQSETYETKIKELQAQVEDSYSKQKKKKELQVEVEELRKKLSEMDTIRETMNEEMRVLSKELTKLRVQIHTKESELEKERKLAEGLNDHLQKLVETSQTDSETSQLKRKELEETKKELEETKLTVTNLLKEREEINEKHLQLMEEYAKFREEQRPSIRTELERRYEETRYRLNVALEKIQKFETVMETVNKKEEDTQLSEALQDDLIQLKGYNEHLEQQFQAQTNIIESLKERVIKQKVFADFVTKLTSSDDLDTTKDELMQFCRSNDKETAKLASNIAHIIKVAQTNNNMLSKIEPLEISTAHHKICESTFIYGIRPYSSVDSSGEWLSNSSEGVVSPDERDSLDWTEHRKTLRDTGTSFANRSPSVQST